MGKVSFWYFVFEGGEYFLGDNYLGSALSRELEESKSLYKEKSPFQALFAELEKRKKSPGDLLEDILIESVTFDFDFAKQLRLFDVVQIGCFHSKTTIGKELIQLIEHTGWRFILYMRDWKSKDALTLEFIVIHRDYDTTVISRLLSRGREQF